LNRSELLKDPQVAANRIIVEAEHPSAGPMRQPRPPGRFDATPAELRSFAPKLGEHTSEVLYEAGVTAEEIAALRDAGVIEIAHASSV
ncbi:MAG: CoA transferase, partial [Deltaproteobacteria bacterium]|nr:CoA transferase [Deltaproteobacteria bacterium]